jgi:hypothetical protein
VEWGRYIKEQRSLSLTAGVQEFGKINGYRKFTSSAFNALVAMLYYGLTLSPKINFHTSSARFSIGPSILFYRYKFSKFQGSGKAYAKSLPGLNLSAESLFSNKPKKVKAGVFASLDLHTNQKTKPIMINEAEQVYYQSTKVNPTVFAGGVFLRMQ